MRGRRGERDRRKSSRYRVSPPLPSAFLFISLTRLSVCHSRLRDDSISAGNVEGWYGAAGKTYVKKIATFAQALDIGVPWIMSVTAAQGRRCAPVNAACNAVEMRKERYESMRTCVRHGRARIGTPFCTHTPACRHSRFSSPLPLPRLQVSAGRCADRHDQHVQRFLLRQLDQRTREVAPRAAAHVSRTPTEHAHLLSSCMCTAMRVRWTCCAHVSRTDRLQFDVSS
jgi:hypothetical protein